MRNPFKTLVKNFLGINPDLAVWGWSQPGDLAANQYVEQYKRYIYPIVSAIAEDVAKIEFEVHRKTANADTILPNHEFLKLIKNPNPDFSQFQFLELHQTYLELTGESFWYVAPRSRTKAPTQFYLIRPDLMSVVIEKGNFGNVTGYVLRKPNGEKVPFDKEEIIHHKLPNPRDPYRGMGPIEAAVDYIQTEKYASDWTKSTFFNSGRPSGILNIKGNISEDEFKQLKKRFNAEYMGTANAGKTMLLNSDEGADYQKMGMDLGDIALKEIKEMSRDDLMTMFRVSKTILGITDDVNRASALAARKVWMQNVIMPKMDRLCDHLTSMLANRVWGEDIVITYKDPAPDTINERAEEWSKGWNKWLTTNDIRRERGLEEIEGGDVMRANVVDEDEPEQKAVKKKPKKKDLTELVTRKEKAEVYRKELFERQEQWEKIFLKKVREVFEIQKNQILINKRKDLTDWVFNKEESNKIFFQVLSPVMADMIKQQGQAAIDFFREEFGEDNSEFLVNQAVNRHIRTRIERMADSTNTETLEALTASITEGINAGESLAKLRKRVQEVYTDAMGYRAERIARTETISASNEAATMAYQQVPAVTAKEWHTEPDACPFCQALNGKVIGLTENFANLGQTLEDFEGNLMNVDYTDVNHPPLHPNCRCAVIPVTKSGII